MPITIQELTERVRENLNIDVLSETPLAQSIARDSWLQGAPDTLIHPWLYSLRDRARMLEGEIKLPHGHLDNTALNFMGSSALENRVWYRAEPAIFFRSDCQVCREAFASQFKYQQSNLYSLKENS